MTGILVAEDEPRIAISDPLSREVGPAPTVTAWTS